MTESTRAASRKARVYIFREFLLQTYGDYLSPGDVVLDVAGGKGDLSWLLKNVDDLESIVVDPRVVKNHIEKSVSYLREHPEEVLVRAIPDRLTYQPLATLIPKVQHKEDFQTPRHLRILVNNALVAAVQLFRRQKSVIRGSDFDQWQAYWTSAVERARQAQTLGYREDSAATESEIISAQEALNTILSAKLIVGFHPDQATDSCIDLALELGIPFCVVPCCVFPAEFPDRRLPDGSPVRYYSQFIDYLLSKSGSIRAACLNFQFTETSKNLALYTVPIKILKKGMN